MKIQKHLLTLGVFLFGFVFVSNAQNLYTITNNGDENGLEISKIRSITFSPTALNINLRSGDVNTIPLVDLHKFTFKTFNNVKKPEKIGNLFQFFPNPVDKILRIKYRGAKAIGDLKISVYTISGRKIYEDSSNVEQINQYSVNVDSWKSGLYIVKVYDGETTYTHKITKK